MLIFPLSLFAVFHTFPNDDMNLRTDGNLHSEKFTSGKIMPGDWEFTPEKLRPESVNLR